MNDENTMNKTSDTSESRPNGHAPAPVAAAKETTSSSKKKTRAETRAEKKKNRSQGAKSPAAPPETAAVAPDTSTETPADEKVTASPPEVSGADTTPPIAEEPAKPFRLRMKVWTDPATSKRYLTPSAFMRDVDHGVPVSDVMYAYAMSDEETKIITLNMAEWNTLPFFHFQEDGEAPRASARPVDKIDVETEPAPAKDPTP
jgi:hypothetical protein